MVWNAWVRWELHVYSNLVLKREVKRDCFRGIVCTVYARIVLGCEGWMWGAGVAQSV
jgi:hypothetical protein